MTLERAIKENPYSRERGSVGAYIRYLRYNVDGWYNRESAEIKKELKERKMINMKAEFKKTKTGDGLPLTIGKMYDVLDVKARKGSQRLEEIKVKNDLGQEEWYKANKFILFAEAAAFLKEPTAAGAGQDAAQSATPDGAQIIQEIDAAAGFTARQGVEIGKAIRAGILAGIQDVMGLHYGT